MKIATILLMGLLWAQEKDEVYMGAGLYDNYQLNLVKKLLKEAEGRERIKRVQGEYLSDELRLGRYLIYSCEGQFFACVDEGSFENCKDSRYLTLKEGDEYPACAPFRGFLSTKECQYRQQQLVNTSRKYPFCRIYYRDSY